MQAMVNACQARTRPIVITAFALLAGSSVILFDPIFQGMAVSLMFGTIVATLLTLLVIPLGCISARKTFEALDNHEEGGPGGDGTLAAMGPDHGPAPSGGAASAAPRKMTDPSGGPVAKAIGLVLLYLKSLGASFVEGVMQLLRAVARLLQRLVGGGSDGPPGPGAGGGPGTGSPGAGGGGPSGPDAAAPSGAQGGEARSAAARPVPGQTAASAASGRTPEAPAKAVAQQPAYEPEASPPPEEPARPPAAPARARDTGKGVPAAQKDPAIAQERKKGQPKRAVSEEQRNASVVSRDVKAKAGGTEAKATEAGSGSVEKPTGSGGPTGNARRRRGIRLK